MTIKYEVKCSNCATDLSYTGNSIDYRIVLKSEEVPASPGQAVTDIMIHPQLKKDEHFCGTQCLTLWVNDNYGAK